MSRHNVTFSPLAEAVIGQVQTVMSSWNRGRHLTITEAIDWILRDIEWCKTEDSPAYGRYSPVMAEILREALRRASRDGDHDR